MRQQRANMTIPDKLPFLEAVCWDLRDVRKLTLDEMLNRYERGWNYRGALADVAGQEKVFIRQLAIANGSWLQLEVDV